MLQYQRRRRRRSHRNRMLSTWTYRNMDMDLFRTHYHLSIPRQVREIDLYDSIRAFQPVAGPCAIVTQAESEAGTAL